MRARFGIDGRLGDYLDSIRRPTPTATRQDLERASIVRQAQ